MRARPSERHQSQSQPQSLQGLYEQAMQLQARGKLTAAVKLLQQILAVDARHADAWHQLGVLAHGLGEQDEARRFMQQAIALDDQQFLYHCNLGNVEFVRGDLTAAAASFQHAIALRPDYAPARYDLATTLNRLGERQAAIAEYHEALQLRPEHVDSWRNLGVLLAQAGQYAEAIEAYQGALRLQTDDADLHYCLAIAQASLGQTDAAVRSYLRAIVHKPDFVEAHNNLSALLLECNRLEEAMTAAELALEMHPDWYHAYVNRGRIHRVLGNVEADLQDLRKAMELAPDYVPATSNYLFALQYSSNQCPEDVFVAHRAFAERFETPLKDQWPAHTNSREPQRRLRIGYVSGDLRTHAVATFIEPILAQHDKAAFEVYCYYNYPREDQVSQHLKSLVEHWLACHALSDDELAARIQADGIDILVDLSGHTSHNRLLVFARKPAPVQVTWIGYPGTTGLDAMDYRLTTYAQAPVGEVDHLFSERLIRLPNHIAYSPDKHAPAVNELPALSGNGLVFGSLNMAVKINQEVIALWGRILQSLPGSRLMLGNINSLLLKDHFLACFEQAGIGADRLIFRPRLPMVDYLKLHHEIDVMLDSFPYNGGTTTMHALWMGVPVVTLSGGSMVSRIGATLLAQVGLSDFVTRTQDAYLAKVLAVAADLPGLARLRQELRGRMSTGASDVTEITRNVEAAFRMMWREWCTRA